MKGTYTIVIRCNHAGFTKFGKLGRAKLLRGYYLYTGSALGHGAVSLEGRLGRHIRRQKRLKWHIDYLTSRADCNVTSAVYVVSGGHQECRINRSISKELDISPVLLRIGSSDCNCNGHLLGPLVRVNGRYLINRLESIYSRFGMPRSYAVTV